MESNARGTIETETSPVMPILEAEDLDTVTHIANIREEDDLIRDIQTFERELSKGLKATHELGTKVLIKQYQLENDLAGQMLASRFARVWIEIQYFDQVLEKISPTVTYKGRKGHAITLPRLIIQQRNLLDTQLRQYMDSLGITTKQIKAYKFELEKLKLRKDHAKARYKGLKQGSSDVDFSKMIEVNSKKDKI